jgi:hypothetical protein
MSEVCSCEKKIETISCEEKKEEVEETETEEKEKEERKKKNEKKREQEKTLLESLDEKELSIVKCLQTLAKSFDEEKKENVQDEKKKKKKAPYISTAEIAKIILGKDGKPSGINPSLYRLLSKKIVAKKMRRK